jgi:hypothetical protein
MHLRRGVPGLSTPLALASDDLEGVLLAQADRPLDLVRASQIYSLSVSSNEPADRCRCGRAPIPCRHLDTPL